MLLRFSISLGHCPNTETVVALENLLMTSSALETLEFDWSDLDPEMLQSFALLPKCVKTIWVRTNSMEHAHGIVRSVLKSREAGSITSLNEVVLIRSPQNAPKSD